MRRAVAPETPVVGAGLVGLTLALDPAWCGGKLVAPAGTLFVHALRARSQLGGRAAEAAPEGALEIGYVAEADLGGDHADGASGAMRVHQQVVRAHEPLAVHEVRKRLAFRLEQPVDVA